MNTKQAAVILLSLVCFCACSKKQEAAKEETPSALYEKEINQPHWVGNEADAMRDPAKYMLLQQPSNGQGPMDNMQKPYDSQRVIQNAAGDGSQRIYANDDAIAVSRNEALLPNDTIQQTYGPSQVTIQGAYPSQAAAADPMQIYTTGR